MRGIMRYLTALIFCCIAVLACFNVFAGHMVTDSYGQYSYYVNDNGSISKNQWVQYRGMWYYALGDGSIATNRWIQNKYYVGRDGNMFVNTTTPDGYYVDHNGAYTTSRTADFSYANYLNRDCSQASYEHVSHITVKPNFAVSWSPVYLYFSPNYCFDRGNYYEIIDACIFCDYEFNTYENAQALNASEGYQYKVVRSDNGSYVLITDPEYYFSYALWQGSMYVAKDAKVYYQDYSTGTLVGLSVSEALYNKNIMDYSADGCTVIISDMDANGVITSLRKVQWG